MRWYKPSHPTITARTNQWPTENFFDLFPELRTHRRLHVFYELGWYCYNCGVIADLVIEWAMPNAGIHIDFAFETVIDKEKRVSLLTVDHIIPRAADGSNDLSNKQPLCHGCNEDKADKDNTVLKILRLK